MTRGETEAFRSVFSDFLQPYKYLKRFAQYCDQGGQNSELVPREVSCVVSEPRVFVVPASSLKSTPLIEVLYRRFSNSCTGVTTSLKHYKKQVDRRGLQLFPRVLRQSHSLPGPGLITGEQR